jgi:hypothetical protein
MEEKKWKNIIMCVKESGREQNRGKDDEYEWSEEVEWRAE